MRVKGRVQKCECVFACECQKIHWWLHFLLDETWLSPQGGRHGPESFVSWSFHAPLTPDPEVSHCCFVDRSSALEQTTAHAHTVHASLFFVYHIANCKDKFALFPVLKLVFLTLLLPHLNSRNFSSPRAHYRRASYVVSLHSIVGG